MTVFKRALLGMTCLASIIGVSADVNAQGKTREMEDYPIVQLRALDKITARTLTFQVDVGSTVKFGSLFVKVQSCRKTPPIEQPESASFLQVWEEKRANPHASVDALATQSEWVFSGWMFASSPALSYMDHPIYDVWVMDCLKHAEEEVTAEGGELLEGEGTVSEGEAEAATPEATVEEQNAIVEEPQSGADAYGRDSSEGLELYIPSARDDQYMNRTAPPAPIMDMGIGIDGDYEGGDMDDAVDMLPPDNLPAASEELEAEPEPSRGTLGDDEIYIVPPLGPIESLD